MIKSVNKIPVLRYGLIVLLVSILFSGSVYLYMHYNNAEKLHQNISKLITARENSELIDSCLLDLYNADNSSRLYAITGDKQHLQQFYTQVNNLSGRLSRMQTVGDYVTDPNAGRLRMLVAEKAAKTANYVQLRLLTDSLIRSTLKIDSTLAYTKIKIPVPVTRTIKTTVHVDTIRTQMTTAAPQPKKRFLSRVFGAITGKNKKQQAATAPLLVKRDTQTQTVTNTHTVYTTIPQKTRSYYRKLYAANNKLRNDEHEILLINNRLVIDIISELKQFKQIELAYADESKAELAGKMTDVFKEYSYLSKITLASLILLVIIVLYNMWKIFKNGRDLVDESEKTRQYADNKSRFIASTSHEIRTPLNSVIGFSEQLSMSKLQPEQVEQINAIRSSSQMLLEVVNEILDLSKYETGKVSFEQQPFMLHQALSDVLNNVNIQAARKGLTLKKSFLFDGDVCFSGDVLRLKQLVMNLMVNAIKFTPTGEILLQATVMRTKNGMSVLKVRVKDTGIGIKKHDLPMIFDEFAQVNDAQKVTHHKGTGLGLAICKKIVELQGGRIKVISEVGKGSVFSFELPFVLADKDECVVEQPISNEALALKVAGAHVLLAEDNQLNVLLAKTILKKWQITFDIAYNGQEGLDLFEDNYYDMVLTDIQMPVMGGLELLSLIRQNNNSLKAEIPVIVLTANALKEDRDLYLHSGANDIVLKPFVERDLIEKIAQTIKTRSTRTDQLLFRYG